MGEKIEIVRKYLSAEEIGEIVSMNRRQVMELAGKNGFPKPIRFSSKMIRFPKAEFENYLARLEAA